MQAKKLMMGAAFCCAAILGTAQEFKNDGLQGNSLNAYFKPVENVTLEKGVLTLPAGALHQVTTLPFPAKDLERVLLSFRARIKGPHVIEENPQYDRLFFLSEWHRRNQGQPLACWSVIFRNREGKIVKPAANFSQFFTAVMSSEMKTYREEFHTPPETATVEVVFKNANKEDALLIEDLKFTKEDAAPTLNVNPEFAFGKDNYSGWNVGNNYRITDNPESPGKFRLQAGTANADGYARGDGIPVTPGENIRLEYKMKKTDGIEKNARLVIFTYKDNLLRDDCQTGQLSRVFGVGSKTTEGKYSFVVPDGITLLRPYLQNATVDYLRFIRETPPAK